MAANMKEVLKPDNKIARILTKICDLAVLNIIWLLTSIFLVTIGPSSVAYVSSCLLGGVMEGLKVKS